MFVVGRARFERATNGLKVRYLYTGQTVAGIETDLRFVS